MFSLNIEDGTLYFLDIKPGHLPKILEWYNKVDDFKFATGIDKAISLRDLTRKYAEVAVCSSEFFVGIHRKYDDTMVGILKGRICHEKEKIAWISSLVIDSMYQNQGFGKNSVIMLLEYLRQKVGVKNVYLSVVGENIQGKNFWLRQDFKIIKFFQSNICLKERQQEIIVMGKSL